ncbi:MULTISPECIES: TIGR04149 family rSAM-modified RiPP [Aquimarina]|nr:MULTISPECIES: TIGR04149 family rSAM-modified RiPP [Aquimarina]
MKSKETKKVNLKKLKIEKLKVTSLNEVKGGNLGFTWEYGCYSERPEAC